MGRAWSRRAMTRCMFSTTGDLPAPLVPGRHVLRDWRVDADGFRSQPLRAGRRSPGRPQASAFTRGRHQSKSSTPYDIDDVWKLQFAQSADVLYIAHPSFRARMLSRFSGSTFQHLVYSGFDGPYLPGNTTGTTMTPSATAGTSRSRPARSPASTATPAFTRPTWAAGSACNTPASGTAQDRFGRRARLRSTATGPASSTTRAIRWVLSPDRPGRPAAGRWARGPRSPDGPAASRSTSSACLGAAPTPSRRPSG